MFESKQRTFAGKMTWILCVASLLVFCFIYTLTVWSVAKSIPEYESRTTTARAKYYLSKVENVLNVTQAIVESHERIFRENIDNPDKMEEVLYDFFADNRFCEAFICVSPGFGHTTKKGLMIDVIRDASGIPIKRAREDSYDFRQHAYFQVPFKEKHNYWNEPYYVQGVPIMTFSHPLMDDKGNVMAVYGVDVNLQIMADTLMAQNAKSKGELLIKLMSRNGRYIVHENRSMIAHDLHQCASPRMGTRHTQTLQIPLRRPLLGSYRHIRHHGSRTHAHGANHQVCCPPHAKEHLRIRKGH